MPNIEALRAAAVHVVTDYMGIAAEFVVDDAIHDVQSAPAFSGASQHFEMYFFVSLGKQLPPEVPYSVVIEKIKKLLATKR